MYLTKDESEACAYLFDVAKMPAAEVAAQIGCCVRTVYGHAIQHRGGLKIHRWTPEEEQYIIDNYESSRPRFIARQLGLRTSVVRNKYNNLKKNGRIHSDRDHAQGL